MSVRFATCKRRGERSAHRFTKRSGDMVHAMEGTVDRGRTHALRTAAKGRGESGLVVSRVRHLPGYRIQIYDRSKECGLEGLTDRARTPYRYANKLPAQLEAMIVTMRREATWGARKLRERLLRKLPNDVRTPACSTIHAFLDRHGLVTRQRRSRTKTEGPPLSEGLAPHALWCTDYKGGFMRW